MTEWLLIGDQRVHGGHMDRQEAKDAAHECRAHGRLSHDSTPPCGCWPGELAPVVALPVGRSSVLVVAA
jgi:hypothetical protein